MRAAPARELGIEFVRKFRADDMLGLAAEVAYHLIFAIPPLLILTMTGAAAMNRLTNVPVEEQLRALVDERAPASLHELLDIVITNAVSQAGGGVLSVGLLTTTIVALWSGSNGIAAIMKAYNRAYDVEEDRSYVRKRVVAVGLTVLLVVLMNATFALLVFGDTIGTWVADAFGLGSQFRTLWEVGRWPVAMALFLFLLAVLYYFAPAIDQSFRWISPGSIAALILWIAALFGFRLYLSFVLPGGTYGAFSSLIAAVFFLYITSVVLLMGAEINAIVQKRYDTVVVRERAEHPHRLTTEAARQEARAEAQELVHREGQ